MRRNIGIAALLILIISVVSGLVFAHPEVDAASSMPSAGTANLAVIDISQWNDSPTNDKDNIDFNALKSQVDAVYIRSFSHTNSILSVDTQAVNYAESAQEVNLNYGFYYFYIPSSDPADSIAQARLFFNFVRNYAYSCVPVLDVENNDNRLTKSQLAAAVQAFADEFKSLSGFDLMIYTYPDFIKNNFDPSFAWSTYKLWIAHYNVQAPMSVISSTWMPESLWCWPRWDMWQYTSRGSLSSVPASSGGWLDMNYATDNILLNTPTAITTVESPLQTDIYGGEDITISGWALSHSGVDRIDIYVDDVQWMGSTSNMLERPDVQENVNSNGRYNDGLHSGFSIKVDADTFSVGQHTLKIDAFNKNGTETWSFHTFTIGDVAYQSHIQDIGWQAWASDGTISGTNGQSKRIEAMRIQLKNGIDGIEYRTYVQDIGWMDWVSDGALSGTSGQSKRIEAIQIRLTGEAADTYDIYYRVHAQNYGWLDWAKNGASSGTMGYGCRLEAIEVKLVPKGGAAPGLTTQTFIDRYVSSVSYRTHIQEIGWQDWMSNGAVSGTSGQSRRLEAILIKLEFMAGGIEYRTHVQDIGWMDWVSDGALSGTSGQSKRLEAIEIRLTGVASEQYDIYYRVHAQDFGWLDWAMNGQSAGTSGYSYRLEAIEIRLVPKGGAAPGSTIRPFVQK